MTATAQDFLREHVVFATVPATTTQTLDEITAAAHAGEVPDDDVFDDYEPSADELAEIESWRRRELAAADKEAVQYRHHVREQLAATGLPIREVLAGPEFTRDEAARLATIAGVNPHNIGEPNKPAAKPRASKRVARALTEAAELRAKAGAGRAEVECHQAAPLGESAPVTTDREALAAWARDYCRSLCDRFQSVKLHNKLFGNPVSGSAGSLAWQLEMMPKDDASLPTWAAGARLSFDKKVGS